MIAVDRLAMDRTGSALAPGPAVRHSYRRLVWSVLLVAGTVAGSIVLFFAQYAFPYQPTNKEAVAYVLALHQGATASLNGEAMSHADTRVLSTYALRTAQAVVSTYRQVAVDQSTRQQTSVG
jgi:hypothetical protein